MMRIMITGSRTWPDSARQVIEQAIRDETGDHNLIGVGITIVHGACPKGADNFASQFCQSARVAEEKHPADWDRYGKSAGFRRNAEMAASDISVCLAFIHAGSKGATHAVSCCRREGCSC